MRRTSGDSSDARAFVIPRLLGRHQIAAATGTSADFGAMIALVELVRLSPPLATLCSAILGGIVNFALSRAWVFRGRHEGTLESQAARYLAVSLGGALLNAATLGLILGVAPGVAYPVLRVIVAVTVSLTYTYPLHSRFVFRARKGWPRPPRDLWLVFPFVTYAAYSAARSDLRIDHFLVIATASILAMVGPRSRQLLHGLFPVGLVFILYDGMRPLQQLGITADRVRLCDLRALEATLFGSGGNTLHDYFYVHHAPVLDLLCAFPYATFILWCVGGAFYLYFFDRHAMKKFVWGFFLLNLAGFLTYHLIPAAPPWYFHTHGCAVDLATRASEGPALARVDSMLGIGYFRGMYGKASSVFGAIPSLHCAYPAILAMVGWRSFSRKLRMAAVAYSLLMVFSAIYLDHHWVIDTIIGALYAAAIAVAMHKLWPEARKATPPADDAIDAAWVHR